MITKEKVCWFCFRVWISQVRLAMIFGMIAILIPFNSFSQSFEFGYVGIAAEQEGMHVWGSSPVMAPDGKVHLYVAQWPMDTQKDFSGWYKDCEIAHYVGEKPEGPFKFVRVAVPDQDGKFNSPHNPSINYIDGRYVLCFIVNENNDLTTQRIVMYVSDDLNDNWRPAKGAEKDGTMLRKSQDSTVWNYTAKLGVSNPTLVKFNGKYHLYNKSVVRKQPKGYVYTYGVALADNVEGPYIHHPVRITPPDMPLEDAYAFTMNDSVFLFSRDFGARMGNSGGGLLWRSADGFAFDGENISRAYEDLAHYLGEDALEEAYVYRGKKHGHLERAQVLSIDGKPAYVYFATGINLKPGFGSGSHLFKVWLK